MQLKSDAGNLDSHVTPLGYSLYFIRPISLGLVALLKIPKHFRMLIIPWPWEWGFASGQFSLGGCAAVVTRMVVLSSFESQSAPRQQVVYSKGPDSISLRLTEVFLF